MFHRIAIPNGDYSVSQCVNALDDYILCVVVHSLLIKCIVEEEEAADQHQRKKLSTNWRAACGCTTSIQVYYYKSQMNFCTKR